MLLLDFHRPLAEAIRDTVPALERTLAAHVHSPVTATQSGFATISRALQQESLSASERAELLAAPLLIIVLLLVFRSLVAAAIPLLLGAMTVLAGRGILVLLSSFMRIDALSLVVCTMMGLALGVDYSLFIVSRFREELAAGHDPPAAALRSRSTAGRTVVFAGSTLFVSLFASAFLQPGTLLVSLATALVARHRDQRRHRLGRPARPPHPARVAHQRRPHRSPLCHRPGLDVPARSPLRRALPCAVPPSLRRRSRSPLRCSPRPRSPSTPAPQGSTSSPLRAPPASSAEAIARAVGPGWEAPFVLIAAAQQGPITTAHRLALLSRWQRRIAAEPGVRTVIGLASLARAARTLPGLGGLDSSGQSGARQLARLGPGLHRAAAAVGRLRAGLSQATAGSGLLGEGSARARQGAALLAAGLGRASAGGNVPAPRWAGPPPVPGSSPAPSARRPACPSTSPRVCARCCPTSTPTGSNVPGDWRANSKPPPAAIPLCARRPKQATIVARELESTSEELHRLRELGSALEGGQGRLAGGGRRLAGGIGRLAGGAGNLGAGLGRLGAGAGRLVTGLGALESGTGSLESGLAGGYRRSYPLQAGLRRAAASAAPLQREATRLRRISPGFFRSGYLALAAIDGAPPARRALAGEVIDVSHGGQAARLLIVPTTGFDTAGSRQVGSRLLADAAALGRAGGMRTGVSGGAATLNDYAAATKARLPLVIGAIVAITFLMLVAILRAPLLAALTVALNLVSVGAAIGVVSLVCKLPAGYPLGGHPYIDTVGAAAIFGVTFGLSIDYAVFLLARMRERYEAGGTTPRRSPTGSRRRQA